MPVLGGTLLALNHGRDVGAAWPWIGLGLWVAATGVASAVVWPSERTIQQAIATAAVDPAGATAAVALARRAAARAERGTAVTSVVFVAALVVMIWQPG